MTMIEYKEIEIPETCYELVSNNHIGMMSVFRHGVGFISTTPVGYLWDERIRVSTLKSRMKYKHLFTDPRITFCIVSRLDIKNYIEIRGHATLEDDPGHSFWGRQFMEESRIMREIEDEEPPEDLDPADAERAIITIHPEQITLYGGRLKKLQ